MFCVSLISLFGILLCLCVFTSLKFIDLACPSGKAYNEICMTVAVSEL